jgi:uncharacterized surface protein with fasciclin (FAS1) repeats
MLKKTVMLTAAVALMAGAAHAQTAPAQTAPAQTAPAQPAEAAATPASAATPAYRPVAPSGDIVETLRASGQFTILIKALDATNLTGVLKANPNLTLFAPTDAAFAALPPGELDRLQKNPGEMQTLLTQHLINATVDSTKIKGSRGPVPTVSGVAITVDGNGEALLAGNATILQADVKATNGVVHVVDKVLVAGAMPPAPVVPVEEGATDAAPAEAEAGR